ncbi:DJ-1/PfpI family protein [Horticoccus luteus]|uniref:DJ-1/PfpI family protein n=1 Tax=Horticoccus luteus TaxID=2862869 RepID=A0A8F9TWP8_9BACT|nr:DJ-1 family glyoxalase III [Horticoccus luteus]QYM80505.1 DJ-1/PfpI family protein [Horticoccus luteus]
MRTVLAILPEGFEEAEAVTPIDFLRRAGVRVTLAALGDALTVMGRNGIQLLADNTLRAVSEEVFDCVFLPGGPGVKLFRADARVPELLTRQAARGGWIAAICAAPTVLNDAGLLAGRKFTAHDSVREELPAMEIGKPVVVDGKLLTSRGAGTAAHFGLVLVQELVSAAARNEVAQSVCWPND